MQAAEVCVAYCTQTVPGGKALDALKRADRAWQDLCSADAPAQPPTVINETSAQLPACADAYDVVVLGGARPQAFWVFRQDNHDVNIKGVQETSCFLACLKMLLWGRHTRLPIQICCFQTAYSHRQNMRCETQESDSFLLLSAKVTELK